MMRPGLPGLAASAFSQQLIGDFRRKLHPCFTLLLSLKILTDS
jgi:hypothetical protein